MKHTFSSSKLLGFSGFNITGNIQNKRSFWVILLWKSYKQILLFPSFYFEEFTVRTLHLQVRLCSPGVQTTKRELGSFDRYERMNLFFYLVHKSNSALKSVPASLIFLHMCNICTSFFVKWSPTVDLSFFNFQQIVLVKSLPMSESLHDFDERHFPYLWCDLAGVL